MCLGDSQFLSIYDEYPSRPREICVAISVLFFSLSVSHLNAYSDNLYAKLKIEWLYLLKVSLNTLLCISGMSAIFEYIFGWFVRFEAHAICPSALLCFNF